MNYNIIDDTEMQAGRIKKVVQEQERLVRKLDRELADKLKRVGDAAGEVEKHIKERRRPTTG